MRLTQVAVASIPPAIAPASVAIVGSFFLLVGIYLFLKGIDSKEKNKIMKLAIETYCKILDNYYNRTSLMGTLHPFSKTSSFFKNQS